MPNAITTRRHAPGWARLFPEAEETTRQIVGDEHCPYYATGRGSLDLYILTNAGLYYQEDCLSQAPQVTAEAAVEDFTIARAVRTAPGRISIYGPAITTDTDNLSLTFDDPGGTDLSYSITQGTVGAGGHSGDAMLATTSMGGVRTNFRIDLGTTTTVQSITFWVYVAYVQSTHTLAVDVAGVESDGTTQTGLYNNTSEPTADGSWDEITLTALNWADTRYIDINLQNPTFWLSDIRCDDISIDTTLTGIVAAVRYSADYGETGTVLAVGGEPTQGGYDVADFDPIHIASAGEIIRYTTTYTGSFITMDDIPATGGAEINLIRVPYRRPSDNALNNDNEALEFIYGLNAVDGSDRSLFHVEFDSATNAATVTDVTPVISGTRYCSAGPNAVEILASNAQVWLGCFAPDGGGDTHVLLTENAGADWTDRGALDVTFVQWSTVGGLAAWFAGPDGIFRTGDRGATFADRTGDFYTAVSPMTPTGVFSIR